MQTQGTKVEWPTYVKQGSPIKLEKIFEYATGLIVYVKSKLGEKEYDNFNVKLSALIRTKKVKAKKSQESDVTLRTIDTDIDALLGRYNKKVKNDPGRNMRYAIKLERFLSSVRSVVPKMNNSKLRITDLQSFNSAVGDLSRLVLLGSGSESESELSPPSAKKRESNEGKVVATALEPPAPFRPHEQPVLKHERSLQNLLLRGSKLPDSKGKSMMIGSGIEKHHIGRLSRNLQKIVQEQEAKLQEAGLLLGVPEHMELCGEAINLVEKFLDKYEFDKSIIFDSTIVGYDPKKGSEVWEIWKEFSKIKDNDVQKEFPAFWRENKRYLVVMTPTSIPWDVSCTQILVKAKNVSDTLQKFLLKENWENLFQKCIDHQSDSIYVPNTTKKLFEEYKKADENGKLDNKSLLQEDLNQYYKILSEQCNTLNALIKKGYVFSAWINQFKDVQL